MSLCYILGDQENAIVHQLDPETQFGAGYPYRPQIEGYIYGNYLFKCCTQLKYAENSTSDPLRVP